MARSSLAVPSTTLKQAIPNRRLAMFGYKGLLGCLLSVVLCADSLSAQTVLEDRRSYRTYFTVEKAWTHYRIYVEDWHSNIAIYMSRYAGNPDIYVRKGEPPTLTDWDFRPYGDGAERVQINATTAEQLGTGWYYIGVHARVLPPEERYRGIPMASFSVVANRWTRPSTQSGMGAIPYDGGTAFRVWAPNASSVHVAGEFNGWSSNSARMVRDGSGHWSIDHRNAQPGQQYKYVIRNGSQTLWRNDPREEEIQNSVGNSIIFDPEFEWTDESFVMPNWNEMVIYEAHIGTLNDTPGGTPGNFDSAIQRLDHVQDLGANAIGLMPINEFAGDFSWGYNPSYPFAVESIYGGPKGLKRFVDAAHERGIAVLLDQVHNHYGPGDLGLWQFDGWSENGAGGIFFYQDGRSVTPWGDTRPDFGRGEVRQYIRDNVLMWADDFHIDGFRFDSTLNIHSHNWGDNPDGWSLLQWINNEIDGTQPWKISIAEDLQNNAAITRDTGAGGAGFDAQWSAGFVHPIRAALESSSDSGRDMNAVRNAIAQQYSGDAFERVVYTESHDEVANGRARVPEEIWPGNADSWDSQKRSTLGAALVMTSPGVPMIFQGQEILEDQYFQDTDPVDWNKAVVHAGIELLYTDLIKLRRNFDDNTRGLRGQSTNVFHVNNNDKMVAFHRWDQGGAGDDVVIIFNFANRQWDNYLIGLPRGGVWKVRFNSDWNGYSSDFGDFFTPDVTAEAVGRDGLNFRGNIKIAPYTAVILSQ